MKIAHINPEGLHRNPAFTHVVTVEGPARTIYVGGQNAVDATGTIVGDDVGTQTRQALANIETALAAAGAALADVVKWNVYLVAGQPLAEAFAAAGEVWGLRPDPPATSVLVVAGLANPAFLVEIDAVAVVEG
jgi:enamine deaminase RidA (YjgF/YER057c/UK114 family)